MKEKLIAHHQCKKCFFKFSGDPGPVQNKGTPNERATACPKCRHEYLDWLNWEEVVTKNYRENFDEEKHRWK